MREKGEGVRLESGVREWVGEWGEKWGERAEKYEGDIKQNEK